ncbi:TolC family protein [Pyrinomonas methylaliphatogenes]|uniref:Outer membrane protein n=1 Tax=Pyrinomonas methylaliphatogenes TaxID=454194 RepID=A0A0B6WW99_9BACT|nr:TolC family protein [Pyrinomonas methylaliphatogenes]CDM65371.1 outer membrane protein [Pyrinomonas methylaliphatogenes]
MLKGLLFWQARSSMKIGRCAALILLSGAMVLAQTPPPASAKEPVTPRQEGSAAPQEPREPNLPQVEPRPVPPLPSLQRVGVQKDRTLSLSLNQAIRLALANNNEIEVARDDVRFAESVLRSLEGIYDPVISFTPQISSTIEPVSSVLAGSDQRGTVKTTDFNFGPAMSQQLRFGGGQYQIFFNNLRRSTTSTFSQLNPFYSSSLGVQFTQPLWRNRAIDQNRRQIRIQKKRLEQSDADFRRRVSEIIAQVEQAYWDLVFALKDQQNKLSNLELAREQFRQTEARVAAGAAAPIERAEVATELASRETDLLQSAQNVSIAENNLKQLILRDPLAPEWAAQITPTDEPNFDPTPIDLAALLTEARENRPELQRLRLEEDINRIDLEFYRNQTRPRIDLQATVATTGLAGTAVVPTGTLTGGLAGVSGSASGQVPLIFGDPNLNANAFLLAQINQLRAAQGLPPAEVPLITPQTQTVPTRLVGGYAQTLHNLFSFETRNVVVGVRIELPLRNRTAEANLAGALVQREQLAATRRSQEQQVAVEVRNAAQAVETARQRVLAAREARRNAELQLEGERRLYQVGRSTTFLLFQRENQLANARNAEIRAETDYNKAVAQLRRAVGTILRMNNITIQSPLTKR